VSKRIRDEETETTGPQDDKIFKTSLTRYSSSALRTEKCHATTNRSRNPWYTFFRLCDLTKPCDQLEGCDPASKTVSLALPLRSLSGFWPNPASRETRRDYYHLDLSNPSLAAIRLFWHSRVLSRRPSLPHIYNRHHNLGSQSLV
jgi:hypothetical protein